jgi:hypothetical protein
MTSAEKVRGARLGESRAFVLPPEVAGIASIK